MLIQLELGDQILAHGDSIDAIRLIDAAVNVQQKLVHKIAIALQIRCRLVCDNS